MEIRQRTSSQRLQALRKLLMGGHSGTQDELRLRLEEQGFEVNQSTISRDLRRIGALKVLGPSGESLYQLSESTSAGRPPQRLVELVRAIDQNEVMIVVHTSPGCASLIARHIDGLRERGVLATIAGDDAVFVAPKSVKAITRLRDLIERQLSFTSR